MSPMFVTVTALVTLVTRAACFSARAPVITSQPRSLRAPLSDGVTLACTVEHLGALVVVWKHGEEVVTAGSMMVSPDPRYRYITLHYSTVQYSTVQYKCHLNREVVEKLSGHRHRHQEQVASLDTSSYIN